MSLDLCALTGTSFLKNPLQALSAS